MKRVAKVVASALLFGAVAGASMVGVNIAANQLGVQNISGVVSETTGDMGSSVDSIFSSASDDTDTSGDVASDSTETETIIEQVETVPSSSATTLLSVREVASEAMPSVVAITNMMRYQQNGYSIFGDYQSQETEVPASGSGVIISQTDTELLIVTNNHVVENSNSLSVSFVDGNSVDAQIKGTDASNDLAVVAVKLTDISDETLSAIKIATLGDSDEIEVGDQVVAIGNALGYGQSVTTGIISAKDRDVETEDGIETGLLQTDAAINPGNSGGALLNMQGELIGINVAKYASTEVEGMGYSIPSSKAKDVIESLSSLTTREQVPESERGYLGVQVKNIDRETSQTFDMPQGVFIYKFTEGATADNSGLQERDIITKLDGQGVSDYDDLQTLLKKYRAGETVIVTVQRQDGSGQYVETEVSVVLGYGENAGSSSSSDPFQRNEDNSSSTDDPFSRRDDSSGSTESPDFDTPSDDYQEYSDDELLEEFRRFFEQYER